MDANELRALADALPEGVHWSDPITPDMLAEAIRRFCADAQPVAAVPAGWKLVPVEPTQAMNNAGLSAVNQYGKRLVWETYKAMLAAAPQAEPKREPTCLWSRADDDTDVWETRCGHAFTIIDGTPTDNQMAFCCYCGRRVDEEIGGIDE